MRMAYDGSGACFWLVVAIVLSAVLVLLVAYLVRELWMGSSMRLDWMLRKQRNASAGIIHDEDGIGIGVDEWTAMRGMGKL